MRCRAQFIVRLQCGAFHLMTLNEWSAPEFKSSLKFTPNKLSFMSSAILIKIIMIFSCCFMYQDHKLKHMAELQQSVVTDQDTRHQIQTQILTWEENLERLHCEQFRLRCYMASLQCGELPNPKVHLLPFSSHALHASQVKARDVVMRTAILRSQFTE